MAKRRSAKSYFEKDIKKNPLYEHAWLKKPGKKPIDVTGDNEEHRVAVNEDKSEKLYKKGYSTHIHTHPENSMTRLSATPSEAITEDLGDFAEFFKEPRIQYMIIQPTDKQGNILGRVFIRKPKKEIPIKKLDKAIEEWKDYFVRVNNMSYEDIMINHVQFEEDKEPKVISDKSHLVTDMKAYSNAREPHGQHFGESYIGNAGDALLELKKLCDKYSMKVRFVPIPGYEFDRENAMFVRTNELRGNLEKKIAAAALIFLGLGILLQIVTLFGFFKITGFIVSDTNLFNLNPISIFSFLLFLILAIIYISMKFFIKKK